MLKAGELIFRKIVIERVAVVKFGMYKSSVNDGGSFVVKRRTDTTYVADVKKAAFRQGRYLLRKVEVSVKDEAEIACRNRRYDRSIGTR